MSAVPDKDNKAPDPKEVQAHKAGDSQVAKVEDKAHQAGLHEAQGPDALKIIQKQAENSATPHVPGLTIVDNGKTVKPGEKSEGVMSYVNAAVAKGTEAVSVVINEAEKGIKAIGKAVGIGGDAEGEGKKTDTAAAKSGDKSHAADKAPAANASDKVQTAVTHRVITDGGSVAIGGPITGDGRVNRDSVIFRGPTNNQPGHGSERHVASGTDATNRSAVAPEGGLIKASLVTQSENAPDARAKEVATPQPKLEAPQTQSAKASDAVSGITRDQNNNIVRTVDGKGNGFEYFRDEKSGEILGANSLKDGKTNVALGGPGDKYALDATTKMPVVIHPDKSSTLFDKNGSQVTRSADGLTTSIKQADGTFTTYSYDNNTVKSSLTKYPDGSGTKEQLFTPSGTVTVTRDANGAATVKAEVPGANAIQVKGDEAIRTNASGQVVIASANGDERVVFGTGASQLTEKSTGQATQYNLKGEIVSVSKPPQAAADANLNGALSNKSVETPKMVAPPEAPKAPATVEAPKAPATVEAPKAPATVEAPKAPATVEAPKAPATVEAPKAPATVEAPKAPATVEAPKTKVAEAPSPVVANLEATRVPQAISGDAPVAVPPAKQAEAAKVTPATAKDAPVAAKDAPAAAKEAPVAAKDTPVAPKDAPVAAKDTPVAPKDAPVAAKDAPVAKPGEPEKEKSYYEQAKDMAGKVVDGAAAAVNAAADAAVSLAKTVKEYVVGPDDIKFGDEKYSKAGDKWKAADGKLYNEVTFDKDAKKLVLKGVDGSVEEHLQSGEKVITSKDANDRSNVVKLDASGKPTEVTTDGQKLQFDPTTQKWTDDTGRAVNDVTYNAANGDVSIKWNATTTQTVSRSGESNVTDAQHGFSAKYDAKGNLIEVQDKSGLYKVTEDPAKPGQPVWKDSDGNTVSQVSIYAKTGEMSIVKNDKESIKVSADGVREQVSPAGTVITSRDGSNNEISVKLGVDGKPTEMVTPSGTYVFDASKNQWSKDTIPIAGAEFNRATGEIIIRKDADNTITTKLNGEVTTLNKAAGNLKTEFDAKGEVKAISSDYIGSLTRQQDPLDSTKTTFVDDKGVSGYKVQKGLLDSVDITKPNGDRAFVMPNGLRGEMTADGTQSRWFDKNNQLTQVRDGTDSYSIDRSDPAKPQVIHQSDGAAVAKIPILDANASAADKANYPYATLDKATGALTIHDNANTSYTKNPDFTTINRISDGNASTAILSDKAGNLISVETSKTVDGHTISVTTDASGRVQSATLPDGSKVEYVPGDSAHDHSYLKTTPDGKTETIGGVTYDITAGLKYSDSKGNLQTINADGTRVETDVTQGKIKYFSASGDMTSMVDGIDGKDKFTYTFKYDANHNLTEVTNRAGVWQIMPGTTDPVTGEAKWLRTATVAEKASADGTFAITPIKNPSYVWEGKNSTADGEYNFVKKSSDAVRPIMDGQNNQIGTLVVGQNGTQYRIMGTGDNIKSVEISTNNGKDFVAVDLTNKSVKLDGTTKLPIITEKTADGKLVGTQAYDAKGGIISRDENNNIVRTVDAKGNGYEYFRDEKTGEIMGANSLKNGVTNIAIGGIGDKYGIDATTKLPVVIHPDKSTTSFDGKGGEVVRNADGLTTSVKQADGTQTTYTYDGNTVKSSLTKYPDTDVTKEQFFTPSGTVTVVRDSTGVASVRAEVPGAVAFDVQPGQTIKTNALGQVVIESANGNQRTVFGTGTSQYLDKATGAVSLYNTKGEVISTTLPPAPGSSGTKPGGSPGTVGGGDGSPAPGSPPRGQPLETPKPAETPKPVEPGKAPVEPTKLPPEPAKNLPPVNDPNQGPLDKGKVVQVNPNDAAALDQVLSGLVKQQAAANAAAAAAAAKAEAPKAPEPTPAPKAPEAPTPPRAVEPAPAPKVETSQPAQPSPSQPAQNLPKAAESPVTTKEPAAAPRVEPVNTPKTDTTTAPKTETVNTPKLEPVNVPKLEPVNVPKPVEAAPAQPAQRVETAPVKSDVPAANNQTNAPRPADSAAAAQPGTPAKAPETAPVKSDASAAPQPGQSSAQPVKSTEQAAAQPGQAAPVLQKSAEAAATPAKAAEGAPVNNANAGPVVGKDAAVPAANAAPKGDAASTAAAAAVIIAAGKIADSASAAPKTNTPSPSETQARDTSKANQDAAAAQASKAGEASALPNANQSNVNQNANPANTAVPKGAEAAPAGAVKTAEVVPAAPVSKPDAGTTTQARDTVSTTAPATGLPASGTSSGPNTGTNSGTGPANQSGTTTGTGPAQSANASGANAAGSQSGAQSGSQSANLPGGNTQGNQTANQANSGNPAHQPNTQTSTTATTANTTTTGQPNAANNASGSLNQQGAGGAVATPVQAGHTATGAQTGTPNAAQQGTGNQTGNVTGAQTGANTSQTGSAASQTTTANPAGHTPGQNAQGSQSSVVTGQPAGAQTGNANNGNANTGTQNAGTQNQQGAGSATASPVLPGGHSTTNTTTTGQTSNVGSANPAGSNTNTPGQSNIPVAGHQSTQTGTPNAPQSTTGTTSTGNQNQQGAGSATATPVVPSGQTTGNTTAQTGVSSGTAAHTGVNTPDPTGHAGTVSGTTSTSSSNNASGSNISTGANQTGQNQQGSAGSVASPILPGGHSNTGTTTGQTTGTNAGQASGTNPGQVANNAGTAATPTGATGSATGAANAATGTGHTTTSGTTAQNGNDPSGHAANSTGAATTGSGTVAHQPTNNSTGATTTSGQTQQSQQGSAGTAASPVVPGTQAGTGASTAQGTGANATQGTGANAAQGTGASTQTGTSHSGNDPAGHTGTTTGTSAGSTSGAVGNQTSNNTTGSNTTAGTTQTGQNQQGSAGSAASPVLPGGHTSNATGTGQGAGTSPAQGTGANPAQGTGANATQGTGVNTGQGTATGAATQTGTSQSGNDPAGHTGTTAGTSAGSTSGAIGNQPANGTAGSNTSAGTTQTGQNQQGSAGSAASPVLPGGHTGNATGTGQGTGTSPAQGTGPNPAQGTGANTTQGTGGNPAQGTGTNPSQGTGANATQGTGANATQGTGANSSQGTGAATQAGTSQSGNDPAGHTSTTAGTSAGSTSGAIGNQPANGTAGSNTSAGTTQTGQNQQGSAGSAASPVLPGGHTGNATGTGQSTGSNNTQGTGANTTQGTGTNPAQGTGSNPAQGTGANTTQGTGTNPAQGTGANPAQGTGANTTPGTGGNPAQGTATGAATPTGTSQSGNDPGGHTGTTAGTSSGSTSSAIGNQPANGTPGSNTSAGTTQTGQNQQGSAGNAASPVLPGGHTGSATGNTTGNTTGTGTNATQGTGTNATQGTGANSGQGTGNNAGQGNAAGAANSPVGAGPASSPAGTAQSGNDPAGRTGNATGTASGTSSGSTSGAIGNQPTNSTAGSNTSSGNTQSGQNQQASAGNAAAPVSPGGQTQSGTATGAGTSATAGTNAGQASGVNAGQGTNANAGQAAATSNSQGTVTNAGQGASNAASNSGVVGQSGAGQVLNTPANSPAAQPGANSAAVNDPSGASTVQQHAPQSSATSSSSSISNTTNVPAGSTIPATSTNNSSAPAASSSVVSAPANQSTNQSSNIPSSGHSSTTSAATTPSGALGGSQSGAMGGGAAGGSTASNAGVPSGNSAGAAQGQAPSPSATSSTASNAQVNNSGAQTASSSSGEPGSVQDPSMANNTNATVDPGAINSSVLQDPTATTGSAPALPDPSQSVSTADPDQSADPSNSATTTTASTPAQPASPDTTTAPGATTVPAVDNVTSVDPQSIVNVGSGIDDVIKVNSGLVADNTPINIDMTAPVSASSIDSLTPPSIEQLADGILNVILNEATAPVVAPVVDVAPAVGYSEPILQSFDPVVLDQIINSSTSTPSKSESPVAADSVVIDTDTVAQGPDNGFNASQDAMDALLLEQSQMAERQRAIDELAALQQQMGYGQAPQVEASANPDGWGTSSVDSATYFGPLDDYIAASYSDWMDQGTSSYDGVSSFGTPYQDVISNWSTNSSFGQPVNDSGLPAPDAMSAIYDDLNNPDSYSVPPSSDTVNGAQSDNLITRYAEQSNGSSDSKSAKAEPTETNIISDKTDGSKVASNEGLPVETNELPNWLDQSMANLGASGLIVEPPKAAKQEETIDMAPPATVLPDSDRLDTEAVTGLKSDLQTYDEKEARWQEVQELQQRLADAINSFAEATRNQVSDVTAQGVEFGADVRQNTEQVLQDLNQMAEEEARLIRENERERLEVEKAQRSEDAKEHAERLTAQQAEHKKHQEERELHLKEEKERKLAQEMATILAVRQQSEAETRARELRLRQEREVLQEMIRKDNLQEKYVVRPNEDLYMIAVRKFKDPRVADLIYELNKTKVEVRWTSGKRSYYVQPGVVVLLPSPRQSREWLARQMTIVGKVPPRLGMSGTTSVGADERRNNIERVLGKIKEASNQNEKTYSVRLGDTLRSVAMKHPDLRDVTLWKLLATKNGLTPEMDSKGSPLAILIRGSILNIPTAEEISAYRAEHSPTKATTKEPYSFPSHAILDLATKPCGGCDRLLSQSATICPACGFAFNERPEASVESQSTTFNIPKGTPTLSLDDDEPRTVITTQQSDTTVVDMDKTTLSLPEAGRKVNTNDGLIRIDSEFEEVDGSRTIEAFSQTCRLVRVEVQARGRRIVRQQLELISGDAWIPVLAYEVGNECSTRHEYSRDGRRKSISIDLPSVAVGQMVQNELSQNWEKYCERFLSGRKLSV